MKKLLLPLLLMVSLSGYSQIANSNQTTDSEINLRYNQEDLQESRDLFKKGSRSLMLGLSLNAVGTCLALFAPDLSRQPKEVDHAKFQEQMAVVNNNHEAMQVVSNRYQQAMKDYNNGLVDYNRQVNTYRGIGAGAIVLGVMMNLKGLSQLHDSIKKVLK